MYSKQDIINGIRKETDIIIHLHSKLEAKHLEYRPNEHQRSMKELLEHLTRMSSTIVTFLKDWGYKPEIAKELRLESEKKNMITDFRMLMDAQSQLVEKFINESTEEELNKEIDLFGMWHPQAIKKYVFEIAVKNYASYAMQLFMYMKNGLKMYELNTNNLWMGKDSNMWG